MLECYVMWMRSMQVREAFVAVAFALVVSLCTAAGVRAATLGELGEVAAVGGFGAGPGQFTYPSDVAVDPTDNSVYVLDEPHAPEPGPNATFRIQKFDVGLGAPVASVEIQTPVENGRLQMINGIAVDAKLKRLYALVSSCSNNTGSCNENETPVAEKILAFSTEQVGGVLPQAANVKFKSQAGVFYEFPAASEPGSVRFPGGLAVDPVNDSLLVFGGDAHKYDLIQQVEAVESDASGASGEVFDDTNGKLMNGGSLISGLTVGPEGDVYVVGGQMNGGRDGVSRMVIEGEEEVEQHVLVRRSLATPGIREIAKEGTPWPLTGGQEASRSGQSSGEQVSVAAEGGVVYAAEVSKEEFSTETEEEGSFELRGMSTHETKEAGRPQELGQQVRVYGSGPGGPSPKCHISSEHNTVAAGSGGVVYALDEGRFGNHLNGTSGPSSYGYRLVEFGPGGSGCPIPSAGFDIDGKSEAEDPTLTVKKGATVSFEALATGFDGETPEKLEWDLDGSGKYATVSSGNELSTKLQYLKAGSYTVGLKVLMPGGGAYGDPETVTRKLVVEATPPKASFEVFPSGSLGVSIAPGQQIKPGENVTFNAQESEDPTGECSVTECRPGHTLKSYTWTFGDGKVETTTSKEYTRSFTNTSTQARSETVSLTVTNEEGLESTSAAEQTIVIAGTPEAAKEPVKEPAKEPSKAPAKEPVKEPAKEPAKKPLTSGQKLTLALKACKKEKSKKARQHCEKAAKAKYAPKHKGKHSKGKKR
jgi:hypothetical protein